MAALRTTIAILWPARPVWIRNIASEQFPDAIEIVDSFHAKRHLSEVGKAIPPRLLRTVCCRFVRGLDLLGRSA